MKFFRVALIALFLIVLFILSISLIVGGATQFTKLQTLPNNLIATNCTLSMGRMVETCPNGYFLGVWPGVHAIDDPFSMQTTLALAQASIYQINQTYPCLCQATKFVGEVCNTWNAACYLNVQSTAYVQMTGFVFKYGSDAMVAIGSLLLVFLIAFGIGMYRHKKDIMMYTLGPE